MRVATLILVFVTTLSPAWAAQPPQQPTNLAALKAAAERGGAQAQLDYAKALESREEGRVWARKAADQGLAEAWFWLGYTAPGDAALPFYEKAAELGYPEAFGYLLDSLLFRGGAEADVVKAKRFGDLARTLGVDIGYDAARSLATIDRCFEAGRPDIPPPDRPTAVETSALGAQDCVDFREGIGRPKDLVAYRKCLLAENPLDNNSLAEIYANGWGVARNPRLAIALVCHRSSVPAELIGMVETLYTTRDRDELDEEFLFCSHVTSGMNQGLCAGRDEAIADARREAVWAGLTASWTTEEQRTFRALQEAAEQFFETRSGAELDMSGTARVAIALEEEGALHDAFLAAIRDFEAGRLPSDGDFRKADAELNAVYGRIMKRQDLELGTVSHDGIRRTERAWLRYRDAWVAFGRSRYPTVPEDAWKAWATALRVAQLKELLP